MSKEEYIYIETIDDLKKKLDMSMMNKKFKDSIGNKYIVRFIKENRKLEILKLQTKSEISPDSPKKEFTKSEKKLLSIETFLKNNKSMDLPLNSVDENIQKEISSEKKITTAKMKAITSARMKALSNSNLNALESDYGLDFDLDISNDSESLQSKFENKLHAPSLISEEKMYISELLKLLQKDKERIISTITNLKNSRIFEFTEDPSENKNILSNFLRDFESEVFRYIEVNQTKYKELVTFPKSINHYSMNYARTQKDLLLSQENDDRRYELILRWEMQDSNLNIIQKFSRLSIELLNILNKKTEQDLKKLNSIQETQFKDAKTALIFCLDDLSHLRKTLEIWKSYTQL
jgi:hypothetical protein